MTADGPPCPHGQKYRRGSKWVCDHGCSPEPARGAAPPVVREAMPTPKVGTGVTRLTWLDALAVAVADRDSEFTATDLFLAHVFTHGHFDYATGEGTEHQTVSRLQERSGLGSKATVQKFLRRCREGGYLAVMPGRDRVLGEGRATPLYRLTLPS